MIKVLDEHVRRTMEDIETEYPDYKYLLTDIEDNDTITGFLYCISDTVADLEELCDLGREFTGQGRLSVVMGTVKDGGAIGVQYEVG